MRKSPLLRMECSMCRCFGKCLSTLISIVFIGISILTYLDPTRSEISLPAYLSHTKMHIKSSVRHTCHTVHQTSPFIATIINCTASVEYSHNIFIQTITRKFAEMQTERPDSKDKSLSHNQTHLHVSPKPSLEEYMTKINSDSNIWTLILRWNAEPSTRNFQNLYPVTFNSEACILLNRAKECSNHSFTKTFDRPISAPQKHFNQGPLYPEASLYVHIIRNGIIDKRGSVRTSSIIIVPYSCHHGSIKFKASSIGINQRETVFVVTQNWGQQYYHLMIENIPRVAPYLAFLRAYPDVFIHVPIITSFVVSAFRVLEIEPARLLSGPVNASVVVMPQGGGCGNTVPFLLETLTKHFRTYIENKTGAEKGLHSPTKHNILLIKRNVKRSLNEHDQIYNLVYNLTKVYNINVTVFDDKHLPGFDGTGDVFYKSSLIVAPHGAGLANMVFTKPGSTVVEVICHSPKANLCFVGLAHVLGIRYHGILATDGCNDGMSVNVEYLFEVIEYYIKRLS